MIACPGYQTLSRSTIALNMPISMGFWQEKFLPGQTSMVNILAGKLDTQVNAAAGNVQVAHKVILAFG